MDPALQWARARKRRHFLKSCPIGLGALALSTLMGRDGPGRAPAAGPADNPLAPRGPHFPPKAKSVIYLHMSGAPPQQDLFDYKPKLVELNMKPCPEGLIKNQQFAFIKGHPKLLASPFKFKQHGRCGAWVSELLPHFSKRVDDVAFVKGMYTDHFNHA